jgi:hypothetical protein
MTEGAGGPEPAARNAAGSRWATVMERRYNLSGSLDFVSDGDGEIQLFGGVRELVVGGAFLVESGLEQRGGSFVTHELSVGAHRAVPGNLIVFNALGCGNKGGILDLRRRVFVDGFFSLFDEALHGLTGFARGLAFAQIAEDLLNAASVLASFFQVSFESVLKLRGMNGLCHFGECFDQLSLRAVEILELFEE